MPPLDPQMLARPIAHRGLHDRARGIVENSRAAVRAAVAAGYGVEIDVRPSHDAAAMVFHDAALERLTGQEGRVARRAKAALRATALRGGGETIPTLDEILALVPEQTALFVELKTDVAPGEIGAGSDAPLRFRDFVAAVARALRRRKGGVAAMSFTAAAPDLSFSLARDFASVPIGLVVGALSDLEAVAGLGARLAFVSCRHDLLAHDAVQALRRAGTPALCWTIDDPALAERVAPLCDQITFEGFRPDRGR